MPGTAYARRHYTTNSAASRSFGYSAQEGGLLDKTSTAKVSHCDGGNSECRPPYDTALARSR